MADGAAVFAGLGRHHEFCDRHKDPGFRRFAGRYVLCAHGRADLCAGLFLAPLRWSLWLWWPSCLVRRKKLGYQCVYALYGCQLAVNLIVFLSMMGYYGVDLTSTVIAIIVAGVMLGINVTYFNKRKHLFN